MLGEEHEGVAGAGEVEAGELGGAHVVGAVLGAMGGEALGGGDHAGFDVDADDFDAAELVGEPCGEGAGGTAEIAGAPARAEEGLGEIEDGVVDEVVAGDRCADVLVKVTPDVAAEAPAARGDDDAVTHRKGSALAGGQ